MTSTTDSDDKDCCNPSQPCTRQKHRDRQATEEALISAALTIFAEKGYENASTRCIADMAGCSESLIQRYFNGKEGLLLAVLHQRLEDASQASFLDGPLCSDMTEEARETLWHGVQSLRRRSDKMRIVLSRALIDAAFREDFNRVSLRTWVKTKIESRMERYAEAGMLAEGLDVKLAAEFLMSLRFQLGFVHSELLASESDDIHRMIEGFATLFAKAVSPRRHPGVA